MRLPLESHLSLVVTMDIEAAQMLLHFGQSRPEERDSAPQIGGLSMGKVIFFVRSARARSGMVRTTSTIAKAGPRRASVVERSQ